MELETRMIQSALGNWNLTINRLNKFFGSLSPEDYSHAIAPGKNRVVYVLGHLAAVHDRTQEILGLGSVFIPNLIPPSSRIPIGLSNLFPKAQNYCRFGTRSTGVYIVGC